MSCLPNLAMAIARLKLGGSEKPYGSEPERPSGYDELLQELKGHIRRAQIRAAMAVSRELVLLYWTIGREISRRFEQQGWGTKIVDRMARDLQNEFPGVEGFNPRNLRYMRSLAHAWPETEILQQLIAKLPWGHNIRVLDKVKDRATREWHLRAALDMAGARTSSRPRSAPSSMSGKGRLSRTSSALCHRVPIWQSSS